MILYSWPRAIAHIDADAFFASVEQALNPKLKGRPVVTGAERSIVVAASYEAKALGIKRGTPVHEVKKICPKCVFVPSDYESYGLFSRRMFAITRRFTPEVEEYSIDEAFADLTGLRRLYKKSYPEIAREIQKTIEKELDITVSIGVSMTKVLAKLCSKFKKPNGLTAVPGRYIHKFLPKIEIKDVWGFGPNTTALLAKHRIYTAYDFIKRPRSFAKKLLGKIGSEMWLELSGEPQHKIEKEEKESYASISKTRTFTPASRDHHFVFAQAVRNLEAACAKARRFELAAQGLVLFLKSSEFEHYALEAKLNHPTSSTIELTHVIKKLFAKTFDVNKKYRATGIILTKLKNASYNQLPLFSDPLKVIQLEKIDQAIDSINSQFGKRTIFLGNGLHLNLPQGGKALDIPTLDRSKY